jgi:hypothetical protein
VFIGGGYWGWPYYSYWGWPYYGGYAGYAPYYDPYYYDYYGSPGGYPYDYYGSNYGYVSGAPQQQQQPPVVINNVPPPAQQAGDGGFYRSADFYLIAFTDHTIQAAVSFHVEGDQIVWTTRENEERRAPLSSVDRRFSEQINRDRRVDFRLP